MKVIDLLKKIVNDEKVPRLIRINGFNFIFNNFSSIESYYREVDSNIFWTNFMMIGLLDEVEILDEEDEFIDIEEIDVALLGQCDNWLRWPTNEVTRQDIELNPYIIDNVRENTLEFQHKINDLIKNQKKIIERLNNESE